jgi:hypothetical protein
MENPGLEESIDTDHNENYLVAFLDILGFTSVINDHVVGKDTSTLGHIDLALKKAEITISKLMKDAFDTDYDLGLIYKQFSDCMSISFKHPPLEFFETNKTRIDHELAFAFQALGEIQLEMLISKVYIRGGLSLGRVHIENDKRIFSEGLINSYDLEQNKAVYPRIIIHDNLINILKDMFENHKEDMVSLGVDKILIRDCEGIIFINPFNKFEVFEKHMRTKRFQDKLKKKFGITLQEHHLKSFIQKDVDIQSQISKNVEDKIDEVKSNKNEYKSQKKYDNILKKYYWLIEFLKWNINPKSSKIKFEYLKLEHLEYTN